MTVQEDSWGCYSFLILGAVHAVADGDDRVEVVALDLAPNLPTALLLNC